MAGYDSPKSRGMRKKYEDRNLDKYGQTTTIAGGIERRKKKKKIVGRDRSNTSRVGVGTLEPDKNKTEPKSKSILKQPERLGENEKTKKRGFFSRLFRRRGSQNPRGRNRTNMNAGGLVKKAKGIDGIAKRGKTRAKRTRG